ncbi:MAG: hypothetical protein KY467_16210 [Gemmatimonadetes bacterium]|nr:hypothetical protein [Gemmatimonadota bacterium]
MSAIEFNERDYAAIRNAAAADGMPLAAWIVANLPLNPDHPDATEAKLGPEAKPPRTMADLFAGRIGRFNSGNGEPRSDTGRESFAEYLEEKQRAGRL